MKIYENNNRNPHWYRDFSRQCRIFNQDSIRKIFLRFPSYISNSTFENWCKKNNININKKKGKRTKKRILKKFKKDMRYLSRLYYLGEQPDHLFTNINGKRLIKIYNILDNYYNFHVDLTVTLLSGDIYNDELVGDVNMKNVFSKIKKNINISDTAKFYIIDKINNNYYNDYNDNYIYIDESRSLISVMKYDSPNFYYLNLGVIN